jgi:DNA-binding NarL/FixJ family response regulator
LPNEYRVGLVDADSGIRAGRRMVLESSGRINITLEVSTGAELLDRFADYLLDVIIIDQRLRGLSGVEVCHKLTALKLEHSIDTRILLTTPYGSTRFAYEALSAGATAVIAQDEGPRALLEMAISLGAKRKQYKIDSLRTITSELSIPEKRDHILESHLAEFELRERSILQSMVSGVSVAQTAASFDVASYRVRKLAEATLRSLGLATLEQLQLRYLAAGLAGDF